MPQWVQRTTPDHSSQARRRPSASSSVETVANGSMRPTSRPSALPFGGCFTAVSSRTSSRHMSKSLGPSKERHCARKRECETGSAAVGRALETGRMQVRDWVTGIESNRAGFAWWGLQQPASTPASNTVWGAGRSTSATPHPLEWFWPHHQL